MRLLLNLIEGLPRNTLTQEAMSQDDELVELMLGDRDPDDMPSKGLRWAEFSPEVEVLYGAVDRLGDLVTATLAAGGAKRPPRISPLKRPETAWTRVTRKRDHERHSRLVSRVLPNE